MEKWRSIVAPRIHQKRKILSLNATLRWLTIDEGNPTSPKSPASKSIKLFPRSNALVEDLEVKRLDLYSFLAFALSLRRRPKGLFDVC